jgi:hypothetical protein
MVLTERNLCPYIEGCLGKSRCDAELDIQSSREAYRTRDSRGFLHYFTEDWTGYEKARGMAFLEKSKLDF